MVKSKCAVVIPVYKQHLTVFEHGSILRTFAVLSGNHDIFYVCPQSLFLNDEYETGITPVRFDDDYFKSVDTYSILCETPDFYGRFIAMGYEWMLICQPDAWIFHDRLQTFMDMDYDYFGGPHYDMGPWNGYSNGNGGLSLRRLSVFHDICLKGMFEDINKDKIVPEDLAFSKKLKELLRLAPLDVCFGFSIQQPKVDSEYLKDISRLPMGTHQPHRSAIWLSIWSRYIHIDSSDIYKPWKIMKWNRCHEMEPQILVVIPYRGKGRQGDEILLAVTGWRKYFRENFRIVIIGEDLPYELESNDLICIHSSRVYPIEGMYTQHLDYINCFKKVHELFPDHKGFIFAADDNYPVNDFTLEDIMTLKCNAKSIIWDENAEEGTWNHDRNRTLRMLDATENMTVDYTTHFPCWFEFGKLEQLARVFNLERESYVIEDLYFNVYHSDGNPIVLNNETDRYRYFVTDRSQATPEKISGAFETKKFICNSEHGWSRTLEGYLLQHYTGQSGLQQ